MRALGHLLSTDGGPDVAQLLAALDFKCNNTVYRPVMDALDLLHTYAGMASRVKHYAAVDRVPIKGAVPGGWVEATADPEVCAGRVSLIDGEVLDGFSPVFVGGASCNDGRFPRSGPAAQRR